MSAVQWTLPIDRKMADDESPDANQAPRDDTRMLRREVGALRARLKKNGGDANQLSWDTELLIKKTQGFEKARFISATQANWKATLEKMEMGPEGICVSDVRTVDAIEFVAEFAARHQLTMTYGNKAFLLEPRCLPE
jgi:hypothetical protein